MFTRPNPARLEEYATLDLERIVLISPSVELATADETLADLDSLTAVVQEWGQR
jgi:hypothetical protein